MKYSTAALASLSLLVSCWVPAAKSESLSQLDGWWDTALSATCTPSAYQHRWADDRKTFLSIPLAGAHLGDGKIRRTITYIVEKEGQNSSGKSFVRARIPDEIRTDAKGNPVVWDLVFLTQDDICWHRVDRDESSCVQPAKRCSKQ